MTEVEFVKLSFSSSEVNGVSAVPSELNAEAITQELKVSLKLRKNQAILKTLNSCYIKKNVNYSDKARVK